MNELKLGIKFVHSSLLTNISTVADIFLVHLEGHGEYENILTLIEDFAFGSNLSLVMTSGYMSEAVHDKFDDLFESRLDSGRLVLTVWSDDEFSESLWEFIHVHGTQSDVKSAEMLIVANSASSEKKLRAQASGIILE